MEKLPPSYSARLDALIERECDKFKLRGLKADKSWIEKIEFGDALVFNLIEMVVSQHEARA